jgi:hypothetical protein
VASVLPSGLNATDATEPVIGFPTRRPVTTSHSRTVPSLPVASVSPSGLNATGCARVSAIGPIGRPVAMSHSRTVPSSLSVARVLPSGLNATDLTERVIGFPIWAGALRPTRR